MSPRSLRRAAERRAVKLARKQDRQQQQQSPVADVFHETELIDETEETESSQPTPDSITTEPRVPSSSEDAPRTTTMPTPARLSANQANAQLSTGPKTNEGKAIASKNALKTGLTGQTVLLPGDDAARYANHVASYAELHKPEGDQERALVQAIADTMWRLDRIPSLEFALYARGAAEFKDRITVADPAEHTAMLQIETAIQYERHFRNLHLQESRLWRQRAKLIADLTAFQTARQQKHEQDLRVAAKLYLQAKEDRKPFDPARFGFEFSTRQIEQYLEVRRVNNLYKSAIGAAA